ncbi:MAG: hypothetical protein LBT66_09535 [Methanobrevibacter sp.]|jgi:hypothetical protein|nr:hypothetical protein [Candidatus Methanovirga meridionalis]
MNNKNKPILSYNELSSTLNELENENIRLNNIKSKNEKENNVFEKKLKNLSLKHSEEEDHNKILIKEKETLEAKKSNFLQNMRN